MLPPGKPAEAKRLVGQDRGLLDARGNFGPGVLDVRLSEGHVGVARWLLGKGDVMMFGLFRPVLVVTLHGRPRFMRLLLDTRPDPTIATGLP
jgi:hypothetical protein